MAGNNTPSEQYLNIRNVTGDPELAKNEYFKLKNDMLSNTFKSNVTSSGGGSITGLTDYFLNSSPDVLDMDMRKRYFQNYAPEGMSFDDFNKAIDAKIFGRGNDSQGTSTFKKWENVIKDKYNKLTAPKNAGSSPNLPSTRVEPNWQFYRPKPTGTSLVPMQNVPNQNLEPTIQTQEGKVAKISSGAGQYQEPTGNQLIENQISTAKKEKEARAKSAARKAQQETAKTVQNLYNGFSAEDMDKIKSLGSEPFAVDSKGNVYNLNLEEDVKALKKARTDKLLTEFVDRSWVDDFKLLKDIGYKNGTKLLSDIARGIVDSPQAQALVRLMKSPAVRFVGKISGPLGAIITGAETIYGLNKVRENWDAEGADWRSRATDFQGAISPLTHLAAGATAGPIGAMVGAGTGSVNMANKLADAQAYRQQNAARQRAEAELASYGFNPNVTNEEIMAMYHPELQQTSSVAPVQPPQQQINTPTQQVGTRQKMQNEIATDTQNLPQASGNVEQFIKDQTAKYGGYNGGGMDNAPPESTPMGNGQPIQPTIVPTQQEQQVQPVVQNTQPQQQVDYAQQIMQMTPEGYVSAQDIMDKLNAAYANINQQISVDPRYQGGVVQANNPYNINEDRLRLAQQAAENYARLTNPSMVPDIMAQNAKVMYEQQMANQLGVPYNDYIDATLEQRKARIANEAQQMENVLKLQAQQATDMKTRLEAMNKMQQLRNDVATEMYKADLDAQTRKDVAMLNAAGGIAKTQAFTNAPSTMMQAAGQYMYNVGGTMGGNYLNAALWMMTPEQRGNLINGGIPVSDEELQAFFGRVGNVPVQFRSPNGQMPIQQNQQQGILPSIAQWVMGN